MQFCRVDQTVLHVDRSLLGGVVDSFADLFDGFYYIFTGESNIKAHKFDNLRSMKIHNTLHTQKSPGIRTNRPKEKQTCTQNKGALEDDNLPRRENILRTSNWILDLLTGSGSAD